MADLNVLPEGFLDEIWELTTQVDENSSRDEYIEIVDAIADKIHELDPERFPVIEEEEDE